MNLKEVNETIDLFINDEDRDNDELAKLLMIKAEQLKALKDIEELIEDIPVVTGNINYKIGDN